jgi:hypothetical protein
MKSSRRLAVFSLMYPNHKPTHQADFTVNYVANAAFVTTTTKNANLLTLCITLDIKLFKTTLLCQLRRNINQ